jgi:nitrite reductase/ring-hydroxylating ferredoxin subunit
VPVMVARQNGALHALVNKCAHRGGPLHEGELGDGTVTCPLHGSVFRLEDGAVCRGPSAYPQPAYDVRAVDGVLELRVRAE